MNIVFYSGGKDSTAMLHGMLDRGIPVDEVVMYNTGKDFPEVIEHNKKVEENTGIKIKYLEPKSTFDYELSEANVKHTPEFIAKHGDVKGRGWPGPMSRWCNRILKMDVVNKYLKELKAAHPNEDIVQCVGIAADEIDRINKQTNMSDEHNHRWLPLVDWGMTEADCLKYCYDKGYDWGGLYTWSDRLSCWCCPLTNLKGWRGLYHHEPELWQQLLEMDNKAWNSIKDRNTAAELDVRFQLEDKFLAEGKDINTRVFMNEYNRLKSFMPTRKTRIDIEGF